MRIAVIAPHPDDETLGCGGTMLRHAAEGHEVHWVIATRMDTSLGFDDEQIEKREAEIASVAVALRTSATHRLGLPTTRLDTLPLGNVVELLKSALSTVQPSVLYIPFRGDAHSDHRVVFDAAVACTKWFRAPWLKRVLAYETLSETGFGLDPAGSTFAPNVFVDVSDYLESKIETLRLYEGEMGTPPFPRSEAAVRALAQLRGSEAGFNAAEAFLLLRERS